MLRLLSYIYPLKGYIWVQLFGDEIILRKVRRRTEDLDEIYWVYRDWKRNRKITVKYSVFTGLGDKWYDGVHVKDWGEFRPWWNPWPEELQTTRLIEINTRAKKKKDGRLRKTRTLPEVWKQG